MTQVSIIVPVHNGGEAFRACLDHLAAAKPASAELIVVDDGSTDGSAKLACESGAKVLSTGGRRGPAYARNLGASAASGDILFFIDADVAAHPDTIQRIAAAFQSDPGLDALIGSYDDSPEAPDFISQYKNLMHHFVHQSGRQEASTFWSGCGAIRRDLFLKHSGFDESYSRPAIEDIELGYRLQQDGRKIVLDRNVQVKHLKRWTLAGLVKTDVMDRGVPWTELILRDGKMPNDLNLQISQRVSVALVFLLFGVCTLAAMYWRGYFLVPMFALLFFLLGRYWGEAARQTDSTRPTWYMLAIAGVLVWLSYRHHMLGLIPPELLGALLLVTRHSRALSGGRRARATGLFFVAMVGIGLITTLIYLPSNLLIFVVAAITLLVVTLNTQFYLFLAAKRGKLFAVAALPFHLLFLFYSGVSFLIGVLKYCWRMWFEPKLAVSRTRP